MPRQEIRAAGISSLGFGSMDGAMTIHSFTDAVRLQLENGDLVFLLTSVAERQPQVFLAIADALRAYPHTEPVKLAGYIPYALIRSLRNAAAKALE